jgi:hypothetical protein
METCQGVPHASAYPQPSWDEQVFPYLERPHLGHRIPQSKMGQAT